MNLNKKIAELSWAKTAAKVLSVLLSLAFLVQVLYVVPLTITNGFNPWSSYIFLFQLIGNLLLSAFLGEYYWIFRRRRLALDERQLAVRRRIFEKSYKIMGIGLIVGLWILPLLYHNVVRDGNYNSVISANPVLVTALLVYALPSIIAAWEKDA